MGVGQVYRSAVSLYATPDGAQDRARAPPLRNYNETNVRADYAFTKGTLLEDLVAAFRYSWLHQDGAAQTQTDLRAIQLPRAFLTRG